MNSKGEKAKRAHQQKYVGGPLGKPMKINPPQVRVETREAEVAQQVQEREAAEKESDSAGNETPTFKPQAPAVAPSCGAAKPGKLQAPRPKDILI